MNPSKKTMRDAFIEQIYQRMTKDESIFFLSADFGSSVLDKVRADFSDRFINVGIAEQNLINISTGLALEGYIVYAYAIAPFLIMRAFEQNRNNLSLLAQTKELNINLVGVGSGISYDVSGPSHHCLEDIALMRVLPNFIVASPSDWVATKALAEYSFKVKKPKYFRLDAKPLPQIYDTITFEDLERGFYELKKGENVCLVSTGYMTHKAREVVEELSNQGINCGLLDMLLIKPLNEDLIFETLKNYKYVITLEEAFIKKGGLDSAILNILNDRQANVFFKGLGFQDRYVFELGGRDHLYKINQIDTISILNRIKEACRAMVGAK
ncbi:MAG: transketolase [Candidatus Omnitrophica bacterium]|nr:transketolase [Candidatus Omnitrophota bacterium]